jgi:RNA polymerase sigma-70 factor (ECF subfamily)
VGCINWCDGYYITILKPWGDGIMPNWLWQRKPNDQEGPVPSEVGTAQNLSTDLEIEKKWLQLARVEPAEFGYFYRKYYDRILKYIAGEIRDAEVVQEMTNEVFSIALDRLDKFQWQGYSFGAWLYRIARNLIFVEQRERKRSPEVPWDVDSENVAESRRADLDLEQAEIRDILAFCINNLDPVRREVFRAHYWSGMKVHQIALVMDLTVSNVKNHLSRGRKQLRRDLLKNGLERGLSGEELKLIEKVIVKEEGWGLLGDEETGVYG